MASRLMAELAHAKKGGFLPSPRHEVIDSGPPRAAFVACGLTDDDLASLDAWRHAYERADQALDALISGRPGGDAWQSAIAADADAAITGRKHPGALERLMRNEPARYGLAHALARASHHAHSAFRDDDRLRQRAADLGQAEQDKALTLLDEAARDGWAARLRHDGTAADCFNACEQHLMRWRVCVQVKRFGARAAGRWVEPIMLNEVPSGETGGYYMALRRQVRREKWLHLPNSELFTLPSDFDVDEPGVEAGGVDIERLVSVGYRQALRTPQEYSSLEQARTVERLSSLQA